MSAETLRRAAALMRERAEAATPGPWCGHPAGKYGPTGKSTGMDVLHHESVAPHRVAHIDAWGGTADAEHIASWHPAVALGCEVMAPLDWDYPEGPMDCTGSLRPEFTKALAVANAYLGEHA